MPRTEIFPILGAFAKIVHSTNSTQTGLEGIVVSETRKTITINDSQFNGAILEKASIALEITRDNGSNVIRLGSTLIGRPYDRIKKMSRRHK